MHGMAGFWAITIITWAIVFVVTFFLVRIGVRANEQVALLKEISDKQTRIIDVLSATTDGASSGAVKSEAEY